MAGSPQPGLSFLTARAAGPASPVWYFLLLAFLGGIVLNIMPCVLPVISLKVLSFARQAGEQPGRTFRMGLVYAAGVLVSFAVLAAAAIALKAAGTRIGWGFQMQEPRFVIVMTAIVFALALSLFGVFEVSVPGAVTARLSGGAAREGFGGAFLNGVLATLLATPCSAPLLGPAIGFAFTQPPSIVALCFLTVGTGLAFPYVLLAAHPRWLAWLPRPGAWLETFKHCVGAAMLAVAAWLLWVLNAQIGPRGVAWTLAFLAAVAVGCRLLGRGWDPAAGAARRRGLTALAAVIAVAGYAFFPERFMAVWSRNAGSAAAAATRPKADPADDGIDWIPFSVAAVEQMAGENQTIFLDFTAEWCMTCRANEKGVLSSRRVADVFRNHRVAAVRADWTRRDETIGAVLDQLGAAYVPLYAILPAGRPEQPIVLSPVPTSGEVERALERASMPPDE